MDISVKVEFDVPTKLKLRGFQRSLLRKLRKPYSLWVRQKPFTQYRIIESVCFS